MAVIANAGLVGIAIQDTSGAAASLVSGNVPVANGAGYTAISTTGTTTVKSSAGVFFGISAMAVGTSVTVAAVDGTNTILGTSTVTAVNQVITALPAGLGQKFTTLAIIVTGTSPNINVLWD